MTATFADGGTLNGSFVFDADTVVATDWSLSVAGGNTATFAPFTYTPLDSVYGTGGIVDGHTILEFTTLDSTRFLFFPFNPDLTDAGGSTNVYISPGNASELVIPSGLSRDISSGTAEGTVVLPEPGTLALLSIGFLVAGFFRALAFQSRPGRAS
jgi:hypothetical protein